MTNSKHTSTHKADPASKAKCISPQPSNQVGKVKGNHGQIGATRLKKKDWAELIEKKKHTEVGSGKSLVFGHLRILRSHIIILRH